MEISYNKKLFIFLITEGVLFFLIYIGKYDIPCLFEENFHIPCLGCGMTTAFDSLLAGDIWGFIIHNVASPFVLFGLIFFNMTTMLDLTRRARYTITYLEKITKKTYVVIIIIFVLWAINIAIYVMK